MQPTVHGIGVPPPVHVDVVGQVKQTLAPGRLHLPRVRVDGDDGGVGDRGAVDQVVAGVKRAEERGRIMRFLLLFYEFDFALKTKRLSKVNIN